MRTSEPKALVRAYVDEILSNERYERLDQYIWPDFVDHFGAETIAGPDALVQQMQMMHGAFADLHFAINHLLCDGDMIAVHLTAPGRHCGSFAGVAATGSNVTWQGMMLYRIEEMRIREAWGYWNLTTIMAQIQAATRQPITN